MKYNDNQAYTYPYDTWKLIRPGSRSYIVKCAEQVSPNSRNRVVYYPKQYRGMNLRQIYEHVYNDFPAGANAYAKKIGQWELYPDVPIGSG